MRQNVRTTLRRVLGPPLKRHLPQLWRGAIAADVALERTRAFAARALPVLIRRSHARSTSP